MNVKEISIPSLQKAANSLGQKSAGTGQGFGEILAESLQGVNDEIINSQKIAGDFAVGNKNVELHQVILAAENAQMALQLTIQIRNKMIEAYQEVMRMQV